MLLLGNARVLFFAVPLLFVVDDVRFVVTIFLTVKDCGCVEIAFGVRCG